MYSHTSLYMFFFFFFFKCHCPARSDKCSAPRLLPLQWQSLIQDLQAEEEHPRGLPPVRAAETCRGDAGQWEPAAGCHAARGRGSQWVDCCQQWVNECKAPIYRNHRSVWPQLPFEVSKHEWAFVQRLNICIIKLKCQYLPTSYWKTSVCIWELHHLVCYCYEHEHSLTTETIINHRFFLSGGFLQPDQHAVWDHHWVLHRDQLLCDVCWTKVTAKTVSFMFAAGR